MPSSPIVAATSAISSGVASTLPWPIAVEPTARSSPISSAAGIVRTRGARQARVLVEAERARRSRPACARPARRPAARTPSCRSARTSRSATRRTTRRWRSRARRPRASPPSAPGSSRSRLTAFASSAADSVMILKTEPGGCGAENATPASAEHLAGARTDRRDPAVAAGQRRDRRALDVGVDRRADALARAAARRLASTRAPASSSPPGVPASWASNSRSRPVRPTGASVGHAARASSAARSGGAGPTRPAISEAAGSRSDEPRRRPARSRCRRGRGSSRARAGASARVSFSPGAQAREHEVRLPRDRRLAVVVLADRERDASGATSPKIRVLHARSGR